MGIRRILWVGLGLLTFGQPVQNVNHKVNNLTKLFGGLSTIDKGLLLIREVHFASVTLSVKIQAVKKLAFVGVLTLQAEQVHVPHLGVANGIVGNQTTIATLDQSVDADIFDDVQRTHDQTLGHGTRQTTSNVVERCRKIASGMQSVGNFVTDQHVSQLRRHVTPHGHGHPS